MSTQVINPLKKFFEPTNVKIVLSLLLGILVIMLLVVRFFTIPDCVKEGECRLDILKDLSSIDIYLYILTSPYIILHTLFGVEDSALLLFMAFFNVYLLACCIVWCTGKIESRKKIVSNMNFSIKKFFEPTNVKIVLSLLLGILVIMLSVVEFFTSRYCLSVESCKPYTIYILTLPYAVLHSLFGLDNKVVLFLISLADLYLLACIIDWCRNKIKNRKQKNLLSSS